MREGSTVSKLGPLLPIFVALAVLIAPSFAAQASGKAFDSSLAGLVDIAGQPVVPARYEGRYRLVVFGFTSCADVCPLTLMSVHHALKELGVRSERVVPIFVSIDPERDTADRLEAYARAFDSRIDALTGPYEVLQRVAKGHQVFFAKRFLNVSANAYVFDHTASILVVGPAGELVAVVSSVGTPRDVGSKLAKAVLAAQNKPLS